MLFELVGGIGLFLMGMALLTDGMKSFAGDALRRALVQFTGKPLRAFASGALVTAIVQSSSATTVAVIGFVSAGLLTFPQAVGVVIGASLGTTGTSWIVAALGLKISVGFYALPLIGAGAFVKLLARGRWPSLGLALAGFGLIFLGIGTLQRGMEGLAAVFDLSQLPSAGLFGHLLMILVGAAMTVLMQSSSAAMAATLTGLHAGSLSFEQASSLVIGAAIGTTVTSALAAFGASVPAKRTALAHVTFNLASGAIAVVLLPLFLWAVEEAQRRYGVAPGPLSLAAFHTAFIAVGAAVFLPFVHRFSQAIERLLPDKGPAPTRYLDDAVLKVPAVALEATRRALSETACETLQLLRDRLVDRWSALHETRSDQIRQALDQTQEFLGKIPPLADDQPMSQSRVAQMHAIDHLVRLLPCVHPPAALLRTVRHERLQHEVARTRAMLELAEVGLEGRGPADWLERVKTTSLALAERRRQERPGVLGETARGQWDPAVALNVLDAMRWLDRVGYHAWRIGNYLGGQGEPEGAIGDEHSHPDERFAPSPGEPKGLHH